MATVYQCDKCKVTTTQKGQLIKVTVGVLDFDVCDKCAEALRDFIRSDGAKTEKPKK